MQTARTRRLSSPSTRPAAAMGEMLESRRLLAAHVPAWGGEPAHVDYSSGDYMPLRQSRPALAEWGMGRMNFLIVLAQASDVGTSAVSSSGISTSSINASTANAAASTISQTASSTSVNSSTSVSSTRFDTVLANAIAARAAAEAVQRIEIGDAVPTTPAAQTTSSTKANSDAVDVKDIMVPVKIVPATPTATAAVTAGPTLAYETVRRPLFSQEQIPAQSRRAIETAETQAEEQPATIIADAKADEAVATASIAPISIDPLAQPMWQRVAAMAAAGLLVVANTVVRRRARRLAMMGARR